MDGRGRALDNIFVERPWRTVKYEDVYVKGYASLPELLLGLAAYFVFYNGERPHQSLGYRTPEEVHRSGIGGGACIVDRFGDRPAPAAAAPTRAAAECWRTPCGHSVNVAVATVWTSRGQRAAGALSPPCPHAFTLCPHCAARSPGITEDACGATATDFFLNRCADAVLNHAQCEKRNL